MASEKGSRKDKNQNIQVFVRLRPLNQRERDIKSIGVVEVANNREIIIRQSPSSAHTKKFTFDRAFGPNAKQVEVYHEVVSPLIEEVLAGYNCTVFAYGQTGTGKTHTMVGENTSSEDSTWQNDPLAGIIPRALSQLFDELRITNTEYTVRVSYLELYNEELFDLLATSDDNSKLRIYEDVTRKGSNIVNGLEEITVYNKREVYKIMAQGQDRKRVASTQMNAQSSRSHTVFTIVVHMKENSPEGEELVKIGKLNLVDLAGSENISKAGSDNPGKRERARECVNINQSLLTLGRVITALVERHPHIPYRESKLTRILQESLGGRTKTSIIATISPGHKDMEETMSTLDYAHRAKNIQNKPEVNQKLTKRAILKEYAEEIDRLKRDLQAARDKNGVYLTEDTYAELTLKQQEQRKEIQELLLKKKAMEDEKERIESVFKEMELKLLERQRELQTTKEKLDNTKEKLAGTRTELNSTKRECVEANHLVQVRARTEQQLLQQAAAIMSAADVAVTHVHALHDNLQTRRELESENLQTLAQFRDQTGDCRRGVKDKLKTFVDTAGNTCDKIKGGIVDYTKTTSESQQQNANKLQQLIQNMKQVTDEIKSQTTSTESSIRTSSQSQMSSIKAAVCAHEQAMHKIADISRGIAGLVARAVKDVDVLRALDHMLQQWYTTSQDRITSLQRSLGSLGEHARSRERSRTLAAEKRREKRNACIEQREGSLKQACEEFQRHKAELSQRLSQQLDELQSERDSTTLRLRTWLAESIQREQAMMNERIQQHERHAEMERNLLEERLSRRRQEIEEEKKQSEERINKQLERHELLLQEYRADLDLYSEELQNWSQHELEATQCIDDITQQVEHGCSAISTDMELFSRNLTELVTLLIGKMEAVMEQSRLDVEREVTEMVSNDEQQAQELTSTIQNNMESFLQQNKQVMDSLVHQVESNSTATTTDLNQLILATTSEINSLNLHTYSQLTCVDKLETSVRELDTAVCEDMCRQQSLEEGYYKDIKIYTPSGNTPDKTEYRYPRSLAATSPHERILNRFRANYRQNCDEDCMIVESDMSQTDSESSVSEDSSLFTAPSPLDSKPIMKSTSESDIYSRGKEQTQENSDRFIAFKRPSKLPAPLSVKKPLVERNDN